MKGSVAAIAGIRALKRDRGARLLAAARAELNAKTSAVDEAWQSYRAFADVLPQRECALLEACMDQAAAGYVLEDVRTEINKLHDDQAELLKRHRALENSRQEAQAHVDQARLALLRASVNLQKAIDLEDREAREWRMEMEGKEESTVEDQVAFASTRNLLNLS